MRFSFIVAALALVVALLLDWYIYTRLKKRVPGGKGLRKGYITLAAVSYLILIVGIALPRASASNGFLVADMWLLYAFVTTLIARLSFCVLDWISLIPRHFKLGLGKILTRVGVVVAIGVLGITWWGALTLSLRASTTA